MKIIEIRDNIIKIYLNEPQTLIQGEILIIDGKYKCYLITADLITAYAILLEDMYHSIKVGALCKRTKKTFSVDLPKDIIGKIWNYNLKQFTLNENVKVFVEPVYQLKANNKQLENLNIEPPITYIDSRRKISDALEMGTFVVDTIIPIGRGQREVIIGDRQTGKTAIAIDAIINQKNKNVICIYVAIGKKRQEVINIYSKLAKKGVLEHTIILAAVSSDGPIQQFLIPYVATLVAEKFRDEGKDVLIVYDDLYKHAKAYRTFSLLTGAHPGREAYPGDIFYIHSRLLERSGSFNSKYNNGTITALAIMETQLDNITNYISTNLISITDGQIVTSTSLKNQNIKPSIDTSNSVSRVGSLARFPILNAEVANFKYIYARYLELKYFVSSKDALPDGQKKLFHKGEELKQIFMQVNNKPYNYTFTWLLSLLFNQGVFDLIEIKDIQLLKQNLLAFIEWDTFAQDFLEFVYEAKSYEKLSNHTNKDIAREVIIYYALHIFAPLIKQFGNVIYKDNLDALNNLNMHLSEYQKNNFEIVGLDNDKNVSVTDLETKISSILMEEN